MAISFVNSATLTQNTSVTSFSVSVPSGTVNGDLMLAFMVHDANGAAISRPGGWTALDANRSSVGHEWDVSYRFASSESGPYTWTSAVAGTGVAAILVYRGVNASPFNTSAFTTATGTSQTWGDVTTGVTNCVLVAAVSSDNANTDGAGTYAVPAGFTSRASFQNTATFLTLMVCEKLKAAAALESGDATSYTTLNGATGLCMGMIALAPTPSGGPTAPLNLAATAGNNQVSLSWNIPTSDGGSAITGYKIYRSTSSGTETLFAPPSTIYPSGTVFPSDTMPGSLGTGTSYTDLTAINGNIYYYKVSAVNASGGESVLSNEASAAPSGAIAPTVPLSPGATPGSNQVALSWSVPSSDGGSAITGYKIYRGTSSNGETLLASPAGTGTAYTDSTAANGTTYFYKITAVNAIGEGAPSSEVSATPAAVTTVPSAPLGLVATPGDAKVTLNWSAPASNGGSAITAYRIHRSTTSGAEVLYASPAGTGTTYTDLVATNGTTYYYKVAAVNAIGASALSSEASATPAAPPTAPRTFKRFYGPTLLGSSATTLYTCPASTTAVIRHIHVSNPSASTVDFTLTIGTNAAGTRLWDGYPLPADDVIDHYNEHIVAAGEFIQAVAGVGGIVNLTIDGYEQGT